MCTVTYIPLNQDSFALTSNRDEKIKRATVPPEFYELSSNQILFPKDSLAGGTWIAASEKGITACLLNGGIEKHTPELAYRKSRGLVLLDLFSFDHIEEFVSSYKFCGIEPFTIIWINHDSIYELRWTSKYKCLTPLRRNKPYIWSSVTLYSKEIIKKRQTWFKEWIQQSDIKDINSIRRFHRFAGDGDIENDLKMKRNDLLETVSITSIYKHESGIEMVYEDFIYKILSKNNINIRDTSCSRII